MTSLQFFNQHSFLMISGMVLLIAAIVLITRKVRRGWLIWGAVLIAAVSGWAALRTADSERLNSAADYEAALRTGRSTLIEFYSNY